MREFAICTAAALVLSTSFALAQGSGAAGDIGSGTVGARTSTPAAEQGTVGQGSGGPDHSSRAQGREENRQEEDVSRIVG